MAAPKTCDKVWLSGSIAAAAEARVSVMDHGLLVGDGVFETLIAYRGTPFAERRHWERLKASCDALGMPVPDRAAISAGMRAVLAANGLNEARVRVTVTSGEGPPGSDRGNSPLTVLIVAAPLTVWPATARVITVPWTRNERGALTGVKSVSYAENVRALALAKSQAAGEAIFANTRDELCEGTGSNIFLVSAGRVTTPPLSSGCLAGVTRGLVIELCESLRLSCSESPVPMSALRDCEEAFLTSTTREVQPIGDIDGRQLPRASGEITQKLVQAFKRLVASNLDP